VAVVGAVVGAACSGRGPPAPPGGLSPRFIQLVAGGPPAPKIVSAQ
jgi:hypothetical protein